MNVCRPPRIVMIPPRIRSRLDGRELVPPLRVRDHPSAAIEIRIERRVVLVEFMLVPSRRVGLPYLDQGTANWVAIFVLHAAANDDSLSRRRAAILRRQVAITCGNRCVSKNGPTPLRQSVRQ